MYSQDVIDAVDFEAFSEEGKFRLRVPDTAELVNTIHLHTAIHEQINYDKWLRKSVYDYKHTLNIGETIVNTNVNDARHVDLHELQH